VFARHSPPIVRVATIPTSPIIWADLAKLIFICPELEIFSLSIDSSERNDFDASISIFIREIAQGLQSGSLPLLKQIFLQDNPCRASPELPVMELTRLLMSIGPSIQILTLIFGQLGCRYQDVVERADLVPKLPNNPFCRMAVDAWKFVERQDISDDKPYATYLRDFRL
jgi:hypothetical protein